jgi:hypothetical protein
MYESQLTRTRALGSDGRSNRPWQATESSMPADVHRTLIDHRRDSHYCRYGSLDTVSKSRGFDERAYSS